MPKRYVGLPDPPVADSKHFTADRQAAPSIESVLRGLGEIGQNKDLTAEDPDNPTFQLGWDSVVWFRKTEEGFMLKECSIYPKDRLSRVPVRVDDDKRFSQIVTRGVASCTSALISSGDIYCLMHLDKSTLERHGMSILEDVERRIGENENTKHMCVSRVDGQVEKAFCETLIQTAGMNPVDVAVIDRHEGSKAMTSHLEFGVSLDPVGERPVAFSDLVLWQDAGQVVGPAPVEWRFDTIGIQGAAKSKAVERRLGKTLCDKESEEEKEKEKEKDSGREKR